MPESTNRRAAELWKAEDAWPGCCEEIGWQAEAPAPPACKSFASKVGQTPGLRVRSGLSSVKVPAGPIISRLPVTGFTFGALSSCLPLSFARRRFHARDVASGESRASSKQSKSVKNCGPIGPTFSRADGTEADTRTELPALVRRGCEEPVPVSSRGGEYKPLWPPYERCTA